jgi:hypothetical protein
MSDSLAGNTFIWDLATYGFSVNHSGWSASMDGKGITLVGANTPYATIVTETIAMDMLIQGGASRKRGGGTNVEGHSRPRDTLREAKAPLINTQL